MIGYYSYLDDKGSLSRMFKVQLVVCCDASLSTRPRISELGRAIKALPYILSFIFTPAHLCILYWKVQMAATNRVNGTASGDSLPALASSAGDFLIHNDYVIV